MNPSASAAPVVLLLSCSALLHLLEAVSNAFDAVIVLSRAKGALDETHVDKVATVSLPALYTTLSTTF